MFDRRQILLGLSAMFGGAVLPASARALEASLEGATDSAATVLSKTHLNAIGVIADIIIPETDTPGALGAGVPAWIDHACANWLLAKETEDFIAGLDAFLSAHPDFAALPRTEQTAIVSALDKQMHNLPAEGRVYMQLKQLVLVGYYTSEVGATEELSFDPVPGGYRQIEVTEDTKAWAT